MRHGILVLGAVLLATGPTSAQEKKADDKVSFAKSIRPIFQANCQGCHQPAKARGEYVMTSFASLLKGGDSGEKAVVAGHSAKSNLVKQITPVNGKAEMPQGKKPLDASEIDLIKKWIDQGAIDDTPANARNKFDAEHPPIYTHAPIIPAIDYSPDGKLIAVAGFHEVLLIDTATTKLVGRLVGLKPALSVHGFQTSPSTRFGAR